MSLLNKARSIKKDQKGYTLISTAIVIMTIGLIITALSSLYFIYERKQSFIETDANMAKAREAIEKYLSFEGHLPCPAPMNAAQDSEYYNAERESGAACASASFSNMATQGLITVNGSRTPAEKVHIGALPVRTLGLGDEYTLDGYNKRIIYAVTASYTNKATAKFDQNNGQIEMVDEDGNSVLNTDGTAIYAIISPGQDNRGAYTIDGNQVDACDTGSFAGGNCDFSDSTFNVSMNRNFGTGDNSYTNTFFYKASLATYRWDVNYGSCECHREFEGLDYYKTKNVIINCIDSDGYTVADSFCKSIKPDDTPVDCSGTAAVNNCYGWFTPDWPSECVCGTSQTRTSTCNRRVSNGGTLIDYGDDLIVSEVNNNNCQLVHAPATSQPEVSSPINCLREGDTEPNPNPETRNCGACPPPPETRSSGSGEGGNTGDSDPLVIDLNADGIVEFVDAEDSTAQFDINNDGTANRTGWFGCNEGVLFIDENNDGVVTNQSEFFGNDEMGAYEELGLHDSNGDGVIDANDEDYAKIMVWQDVNGDGISQANEMTSLATQNILEIGIEHDEIDDEFAEQDVKGRGYFRRLLDDVTEYVSKTYEAFLNYFKN